MWAELDRVCREDDGCQWMAIPHNSNASNGEMFAKETYSGEPITEDYVSLRMANEPLVEITQLKGTSDAHPILSPNDEWADFERYENYIGAAVKATVNDGDFVRQSLARGLEIEEAVGATVIAKLQHDATPKIKRRKFRGTQPIKLLQHWLILWRDRANRRGGK